MRLDAPVGPRHEPGANHLESLEEFEFLTGLANSPPPFDLSRYDGGRQGVDGGYDGGDLLTRQVGGGRRGVVGGPRPRGRVSVHPSRSADPREKPSHGAKIRAPLGNISPEGGFPHRITMAIINNLGKTHFIIK